MIHSHPHNIFMLIKVCFLHMTGQTSLKQAFLTTAHKTFLGNACLFSDLQQETNVNGGTLEKFPGDANEKLLERWRDIILMWVAPLLLRCDFYCARVSVMTGNFEEVTYII